MRLSFFRTGTGHRVGKRPLATPFIPQISFTREVPFRRLIRSLSLRPYSLLASQADRTGAAQRPPCPPRLLRPGFQIAGSPHASAGYDYAAKLRIAPAGLSPASTAASLAAPCPGTGKTASGTIRLHRPKLSRLALHHPHYSTAKLSPKYPAVFGGCIRRVWRRPRSAMVGYPLHN